MSDRGMANWRLMFQGRPSQAIRSVMITALMVLALSVWAVTVLGVGILGGGKGLGPQSATASEAEISCMPAADELLQRLQGTGAARAGKSAGKVAMPVRDPFEASALHFGRMVSQEQAGEDGGSTGGTGTAGINLAAGLVQETPKTGTSKTGDGTQSQMLRAPLKLDGIMSSGGSSVAVINGHVFKVGETIKVGIGEQVLDVEVLSISQQGVELGAGDDRITLRMGR